MDAQAELQNIIERQRDQLVGFARRVLQVASVNGVDDEIAVAERFFYWSKRFGLDAQIVGENPRRPNVIVTLGQGEPDLLLIGHLDTVAAGDPSRWTHPPLSGTIVDGKLFGRGAIDTKGGMAAALFALVALKTWGQFKGTVQFIGVPDEESGATGTLGIKWLHEHGMLRGKGAIYCYGGHDIILGHRGLYRARVTCHGEAVHPGFPAWQNGEAGANAVTGMAKLLLALENITTEFSAARHFERFRTVVTPGTMIEGGTAINIVPDRCVSYIDARLTPETSSEQVRGWIDAVIGLLAAQNDSVRYHVETINDLPAAISDENAPIFQIVERVTHAVTGETPPRIVAGPANEGYLLIERGIPTVCGFGPIGANAHSADEYVVIDSLLEAALLYAVTAIEMSRT